MKFQYLKIFLHPENSFLIVFFGEVIFKNVIEYHVRSSFFFLQVLVILKLYRKKSRVLLDLLKKKKT